MRRPLSRADAADMIVRLVTALTAALLLAGCSTEEGMRAQTLLQQAEAAQANLRSSTFDGSVGVSAEGAAFRMVFTGATSQDGEWVSLRTSGSPNGGDMALELLIRGSRAWMKSGSGWESMPAPTGAGSSGTLSAAAFQQLARYVKDVRVTEHQLIQGKSVTTIAGEIDTKGMIEAFAKLGSFAEGMSLDLSKLGIDFGDIRAVLTIDERTQLLDTAFVTFAISAEGKSIEVDLRYRLASANEPVQLPSPHG
jgi:hypothetical protein